MTTRPLVEDGSLRTSATEEDLEEARQRLLVHVDGGAREVGYASIHDLPANGYPPQFIDAPPPQVTALPTTVNSTRQWPATYGTVATNSLRSVRSNHRKPVRVKRYRIPFLVLQSFDWGLVMFFSVVVMNSTDFKGGHYFDLNIRTKYFDLVIIGTFRVALNLLFYLVLGWVTRITMAVTTLTSSLYIPIKAYYSWGNVSNDLTLQSIAILMMFLVTFGMPWISAFFFEFKYLPAELARLNIPSWWSLEAWLWPRAFAQLDRGADTPSLQDVAERYPVPVPRGRAGLSASTVSLDFRTPVGSSRASPVPNDRRGDEELPPITEDDQEYSSSLKGHSPEYREPMSSEDLRFKREALNVIETFRALTGSSNGWTLEKEDEMSSIYTQSIERRKVWKAEGVFQVPARALFRALYPGDNTPDWNPQCRLNQTVHRVDDATDVVYTVSNAMGPVSARDFVSIRQMERSGGHYYAASKAIVTAMKPEEAGKVRAENGPCGYLVMPISDTQSKLLWILDSNLKGWLPQSVIDQTLSSVLSSSMEKLRIYINTQHGVERI